MLSESLGAARAAVRDFFRTADDNQRDKRRNCRTESVDEWGVLNRSTRQQIVTEHESSHKETSDSPFVTSQSFQSSLTEDIPLPSIDHAIIMAGPQRSVPDAQQGPPVAESHPVLERTPKSAGSGHSTSPRYGGIITSPSYTLNHVSKNSSHGRKRPADMEAQQESESETMGVDADDDEERLSNVWLFTDSILFAYRAMRGHGQAHTTELYSWLRHRHTKSGIDDDCAPLMARLERQVFLQFDLGAINDRLPAEANDAARYSENPTTSNVFVVPRPKTVVGKTPWVCEPHPTLSPRPSGTGGRARQQRPEVGKQDPRLGEHSDFIHDYDISDDEGDPATGRISPHTFRLWAAGSADGKPGIDKEIGCMYGDGPDDNDYDAICAPTSTQEQPQPPELTPDNASTWSDTISLGDKHKHILLRRLTVTNYLELANARYDQFLKWQHALELYFLSPPPLPTHRVQPPIYSSGQDEILSALNHPLAPPLFDDVPKHGIYEALRARYQLLVNSEYTETQMKVLQQDAQARASFLYQTLDNITKHVVTILDRRYPAPTTDVEILEVRKREEIYRHLEEHLLSVSERYMASQERLSTLAGQVQDVREAEEKLGLRARALAGMVGATVEGVGWEEIERELLLMVEECDCQGGI
ncbi:hypothetical protein QQS21_012334 [Conoideocrella luteorostrata]|uniref:Uncharacterized protein n=1 Tax=Conoideocrella luteorostrata TaxID=1105319 RepID=A0AAJ0FMR6_9HYPO|nr:hypothetical protein QQS21_012334 [Conoideocrella luteorostrata]